MKIVSHAPHLHSGNSTTKIMRDVVIALLPAFAFSVYFYGMQAIYVTGIAIISCMTFEWVINKYMLKKANTLTDYSAALTGMLLAFNLPPNIPAGIIVVGSLVAIGIGKMSYGGLGRNLFNPALVGRVFLLISFPVQMTTFPATDATTGATPLSFLKEAVGKGLNLNDIMPADLIQNSVLGFKDGSLGEIAGLMIILGGIYLLVRKVITWHIPVVILGTIGVFTTILWLIDPTIYINPIIHVFAGGALLGAIFMATDYVTSPMNPKSQIVYAFGIGVITVLIRVWGAYPEGISFAILIMNAAVPLINNALKPKRYGEKLAAAKK